MPALDFHPVQSLGQLNSAHHAYCLGRLLPKALALVARKVAVHALKYAAAGSEPPGAKVGGWIHHPKVLQPDKPKPGAKRTRVKQVGEVLAQIQCEFEVVDDNNKRKRLVAKRCLKGTIDMKKNKMTKATLDGTIQLRNFDSGLKEMEASHKVLDMNKIMNKYLQIPKPILEYVIFCHQEDTLWPFDEGKALKEKFDDIFQSSEFVHGEFYKMDPKLAQKGCDRDSSRNTNPKIAHLFSPRAILSF